MQTEGGAAAPDYKALYFELFRASEQAIRADRRSCKGEAQAMGRGQRAAVYAASLPTMPKAPRELAAPTALTERARPLPFLLSAFGGKLGVVDDEPLSGRRRPRGLSRRAGRP
ncbi:MAG: hypothetical protein ACLVJH_04445 [Faecalibacterium prausnitzii]